jgi:uncharacterized membrane protein YhaH (DUF805 family)
LKRELGPFDWQFYLILKGRISPHAYVIGGQVIGMVVFCAAILPIGISMFWEELVTARLLLPIFLLFFAAIALPASSLVVRRAHDLGWPAAFALAISALPLALVVVVVAKAGRGASGAPWLESSVVTPLGIAAFMLCGVLYFWLALKKGQPMQNRYGAPPQ